ncbi:ABC transporter permease [Paraclostridium ghonii]|uniref:Cobalamin synthase n=1 Tax=Paraclostridium ghonii TaxID=29358 RepID=A0ABU0MXB8_9FIRM|nr:ABC transporter permease [Paeniclostridium ghonii]MDQ0555547.1 cobalamin synthase [Paeniclostridium ghonii]
MLGKLLKYELKSTAKFFVPMYFAILVITTLNSIFMRKNVFQEAQGIISMVIGALFIALTTLTIIVIVKRFKKNLLGDEGYLMFTLPVSSGKLILSKYISALIWISLTAVVTMMAVIIYTNGMDPVIEGFFRHYFKDNQTFIMALTIIVLTLSAISTVVFIIYNSIAIAQLPIFTKHKTLVSIISFFVIGKVVNIIYDLIENNIKNPEIYNIESVQAFKRVISIGILENIFIVIILFICLNYTLNKKLNLD